MPTHAPFGDLVARAREGDEQAAVELVQAYEPEIRRFIRFRLKSLSFRRVFDSMDICQSVMAKFFVQLETGDFRLDDPEQLSKLLVTMARNKLTDRVREQQAARRDIRRLSGGDPDVMLAGAADGAESPSETAAGRELVALIHAYVTEEERYLIGERMSGRSWKDLADELACEPDAVRKRVTRAIDRAAERLGLVATNHGETR